QQLLVLEVPKQESDRIGRGLIAQIEGRNDGVGNEPGLAHVGKLDQPRAGGKAPREIGGGADGKTRLAYAARADQADDPGRCQLLAKLCQLAPATDEAGRFSREVAQTADRPGHRCSRYYYDSAPREGIACV